MLTAAHQPQQFGNIYHIFTNFANNVWEGEINHGENRTIGRYLWLIATWGRFGIRRLADGCFPENCSARRGFMNISASPPLLIRAYLAFSSVSSPLWRMVLHWRAREGKEDRARLPEKWGHAQRQRPNGELIWLHGVSVGETGVLLTLLERLSAARPQTHFLLTSITRASADALAARKLPERVMHHYAPVDCPQAIRRFLDHWHPDLFILSEMDLWPRMLVETKARDIPMLMLNAHVTPRRLRRRRRVARANGWLMDHFEDIHVQDERSFNLFQDIGAPKAKMRVTGLLKAASAPPPDHPAERTRLSGQIGNRPVWLAASTRQAEEAEIMRAHAHALGLRPDLLMIIAPRQMKDADKTEAEARAVFAAERIARRGRGEDISEQTQVYIADSLGEMGLWYRLVPVAYPGQSLPLPGVRMGGKNPFEALGLGVMIVHGPQTANFSASYDMLRKSRAALEVTSAQELGKAVSDAQDPPFRAPYLEAAARVLADVTRPLDLAFSTIVTALDDRRS